MAAPKTRLELPCEYATRVIIPSIRAGIARILVEEFGMSRYSAAKALRTTPAAVTNYLEKRRGDKYVDKIVQDPEIKELAKESARMLASIINEKDDDKVYGVYQKAICNVCSRINTLALAHGCPATSK